MDDTGEETNEEDRSLRDRLASAWKAQRARDFYRIVHDELISKIHAGLRPEFRILSDEDLDDCIAEAITAFVRRSDPAVANPESYIWMSARNQALDMIEDRARTRDAAQTSADGEPNQIDAAAAVVLIEGLVDDVDAGASWAAEVVQVAVERLRPALKRVVRYVLENGTECDAASAASALCMTPGTFRANKSNAYNSLRSLIPIVIAEKGIVPPTPRLAEAFADQHRFAEDDE